MTFTHALSTNNYGTAKFIVDASAANGTHTTIAAALTSASSGDTIFIRPGTYTENITLKVGVNLVAYDADALTPNVIISGKCTFTTAGAVAMSGIRFQTNSDFAIAVTGSAASTLTLTNCFLNCTNNTGISFTSSNAGAVIQLINCQADVGTTGITYFVSSSTGVLTILEGNYGNTGATTTASSASAGQVQISYVPNFQVPLSFTGTATVSVAYCRINCSTINTAAFTSTSSDTGQALVFSRFDSGTASAISITTGTLSADHVTVISSNTNAITGTGTIKLGVVVYLGTSSTVNTSTITSLVVKPTLKATPFQFTYDLTTASGTQNFTSLAFKPIALVGISTAVQTTGTTVYCFGGHDDGTNHYCTEITAAAAFGAGTVSIFVGDTAGAGARFQTGVVSAFLSNGFTITWTKTGVPTGTAIISGMAIGYQ